MPSRRGGCFSCGQHNSTPPHLPTKSPSTTTCGLRVPDRRSKFLLPVVSESGTLASTHSVLSQGPGVIQSSSNRVPQFASLRAANDRQNTTVVPTLLPCLRRQYRDILHLPERARATSAPSVLRPIKDEHPFVSHEVLSGLPLRSPVGTKGRRLGLSHFGQKACGNHKSMLSKDSGEISRPNRSPPPVYTALHRNS